MAINPQTQYPGKIAPSSANYPYGQARNITVPSDGTGTPWEAALVNDIFGFQQHLLSSAGIVPSGSPDNAVDSQYTDALHAITSRTVADYAAIRALSTSKLKNNSVIFVRDVNLSGWFVLVNSTAHGLTDNAITRIVISANWYALRLYAGDIHAVWAEGGFWDYSGDDGPAIQVAVDALPDGDVATAGRIILPKEVRIDTTVLIHNKQGIKFQGSSMGGTVITTTTDCLFDTSRLAAYGSDVVLQSEYNRRAAFIITTYDAEIDRDNADARQVYFSDIEADFSGSTTARAVALVSCPSLAFAKFDSIRVVEGLAIFDAWLLSNGDSRFYHIEWNDCRTSDCEHHVYSPWTSAYATQQGTTWIFRNNQTAKNISSSIEIKGISYCVIAETSVDNNAVGHYAYNLEDCRTVTIIEPGIETRYQHAGVGYGSGVLKISGNSRCKIIGGFMVGGDNTGAGNGLISDYDDGSNTVVDSLIVIADSAQVEWMQPNFDLEIDGSGNDWPIYVQDTASLKLTQGSNNYDVDELFINDTATCLFTDKENAIKRITSTTYSITGATQANPCQVTIPGHGRATGDRIRIQDVAGMVELNAPLNQPYTVTVVDANNVTLDGINSTAFTAYTSGGEAVAQTVEQVPFSQDISFTPTLEDAASGGNVASPGTAIGVGKLLSDGRTSLQIQLNNIDTTGLTGANDVYIKLPYTARSIGGTIRWVGSVVLGNVTFSGFVTAQITDNTDYIRLAEMASGAGVDFITVAELASGTADIWLDITFERA